MITRIEDITVIAADDFLSYEGEMIFVDTPSPFASQPIAQAYVAMGEAETELPDMWQESSVFGSDVFLTFGDGTIHTFLSLDLQDQVEPGTYIFIKVIAIGDTEA